MATIWESACLEIRLPNLHQSLCFFHDHSPVEQDLGDTHSGLHHSWELFRYARLDSTVNTQSRAFPTQRSAHVHIQGFVDAQYGRFIRPVYEAGEACQQWPFTI